jgi:DNA-binding response OmpR family regulator
MNPSNTSRKRILLVDDDEEVLQAMRVACEERGFDVLVARDGAEALIRVERDVPQLVVLDIVMPKRSGFLVLERLRQSPHHSPKVVMITANEEIRHRQAAEARGVDAFINKPFDIRDLLATIDRLLGE